MVQYFNIQGHCNLTSFWKLQTMRIDLWVKGPNPGPSVYLNIFWKSFSFKCSNLQLKWLHTLLHSWYTVRQLLAELFIWRRGVSTQEIDRSIRNLTVKLSLPFYLIVPFLLLDSHPPSGLSLLLICFPCFNLLLFSNRFGDYVESVITVSCPGNWNVLHFVNCFIFIAIDVSFFLKKNGF